jgi:hypothetical protein
MACFSAFAIAAIHYAATIKKPRGKRAATNI